MNISKRNRYIQPSRTGTRQGHSFPYSSFTTTENESQHTASIETGAVLE